MQEIHVAFDTNAHTFKSCTNETRGDYLIENIFEFTCHVKIWREGMYFWFMHCKFRPGQKKFYQQL